MPGVCHEKAQCEVIGHQLNCICQAGFTGDGLGPNGCVQLENPPCPDLPCANGGSCNLTNMTCSCANGFLPPLCLHKSPCDPNPCQMGGICSTTYPTSNLFHCNCAPNREGSLCELEGDNCGRKFSSANGTLRYPMTVHSNTRRCFWIISTKLGSILDLKFDHFDGNAMSCSHTSLSLHDGPRVDSPRLGPLIGCGSESPVNQTFTSRGNSLYVVLQLEHFNQSMNFQFSWTSHPPECGGVISMFGGVRMAKAEETTGSLSYNHKNHTKSDCYWYIKARPGKRIQLSFEQVNFQNNCPQEFIRILEGLKTDGDLLRMICYTNTTHPSPITTSNHQVTIHFHTDGGGGVEDRFHIVYEVVDGIRGCGGVFTDLSGRMSSPRGGNWVAGAECDYLISLPIGYRVKIIFEYLYDGECGSNSLTIFDGDSAGDDKIARRICSWGMPDPFEAIGNEVLLRYKYSITRRFKLIYKLRKFFNNYN